MKLRGLVALLGLALAAVLIGMLVSSHRELGPVYTVAQVQAGLAHDARAWQGRTVQVRGVVIGGSCSRGALCEALTDALLTDTAGPPDEVRYPGQPLPLVLGPQDAPMAVLRRLPFLGPAMPRPQQVTAVGAATYRVRLQSLPDDSCGHAHCFGGLLLDSIQQPR